MARTARRWKSSIITCWPNAAPRQPTVLALGIALAVDDVPAARAAVLAAGGRAVGEIVTLQIATGARVTWCYVTDPEDNIIELQSWSNGEQP